jgi:hypothetical protein
MATATLRALGYGRAKIVSQVQRRRQEKSISEVQATDPQIIFIDSYNK